jgi:hypothetical protein
VDLRGSGATIKSYREAVMMWFWAPFGSVKRLFGRMNEGSCLMNYIWDIELCIWLYFLTVVWYCDLSLMKPLAQG